MFGVSSTTIIWPSTDTDIIAFAMVAGSAGQGGAGGWQRLRVAQGPRRCGAQSFTYKD